MTAQRLFKLYELVSWHFYLGTYLTNGYYCWYFSLPNLTRNEWAGMENGHLSIPREWIRYVIFISFQKIINASFCLGLFCCGVCFFIDAPSLDITWTPHARSSSRKNFRVPSSLFSLLCQSSRFQGSLPKSCQFPMFSVFQYGCSYDTTVHHICSFWRILSIPSSDGIKDTFSFLIFGILIMQVMILCDLSMCA